MPNDNDAEQANSQELIAVPVMPATPARHTWRQKGEWIECETCTCIHGLHVGIHRRLVGVNEQTGEPILRDLDADGQVI